MTESLLDRNALGELERQIGRDRLLRVISIQLLHGRALLEKLKELCTQPDPQSVRFVAHQLAGSSSAVGMLTLGEAASALEIHLVAGKDEGLGSLVQALWVLGIKSHDALEAEFGPAPNSAA